jgi:hypothetical protein
MIPVVEIGFAGGKVLKDALQNGTNIKITVADSDYNIYLETVSGGLAIGNGIIIGGMSACGMGIAIFKLVCHIRAYGRQLTIAQAVFIISIVSNFMLFWFSVINPARLYHFAATFSFPPLTLLLCVGLPMGIPFLIHYNVFFTSLASDNHYNSPYLSQVARVDEIYSSEGISLPESPQEALPSCQRHHIRYRVCIFDCKRPIWTPGRSWRNLLGLHGSFLSSGNRNVVVLRNQDSSTNQSATWKYLDN